MKYSLGSLMTFSIRDLLLVTVIVALAVGWWVDRRSDRIERRQLKEKRQFCPTLQVSFPSYI